MAATIIPDRSDSIARLDYEYPAKPGAKNAAKRDSKPGRLVIEFTSGSRIAVHGVSGGTWRHAKAVAAKGGSLGKWYHRNIRGQYRPYRMTPATAS